MLACLSAGTLLALAPSASAVMWQRTLEFAQPIEVDLTVQPNSCTRTTSGVSIRGGVGRPTGVGVNTLFANQRWINPDLPGFHYSFAEDGISSVVTSFTAPRGAVFTGQGMSAIGGNPWIYANVEDAALDVNSPPDRSDAGWVRIGRCKSGAGAVNAKIRKNLPARSTVTLGNLTCDNKGTQISLSSSTDEPGVRARFAFANNDKWTKSGDGLLGTISVGLDPPAHTDKHGSINGPVGGNPWVWAQMVRTGEDAGGLDSFGDPMGRCVQGSAVG